MVVCTSTGKASADYIFCGTNSGDIVKLYVDFLANGQAHHMFSRFLNLRNLVRNFLCFVFLHRAVVSGGAEGALAPPEFGKSVNPIPTRGGRLCPPHYC